MIKDPQARIAFKQNWNNYFLFSIESPKISAKAIPGQFIMVRINAYPYPLLRRPFSIHDANSKTIEIFFQKTGFGTSLLGEKNTKGTLDILGPLGKGFNVKKDDLQKTIAIIGGGRGMAPLYFLARSIQEQGASIKVFYGGKTLQDLPLREKFEARGFELYCSTEDGSFGFKGLITDFFEDKMESLSFSRAFACGPEAMLEKVALISRQKRIPSQLSLESVMGCGFGACWGCVKKMREGKEVVWVKICEQGPVFPASDIIF